MLTWLTRKRRKILKNLKMHFFFQKFNKTSGGIAQGKPQLKFKQVKQAEPKNNMHRKNLLSHILNCMYVHGWLITASPNMNS